MTKRVKRTEVINDMDEFFPATKTPLKEFIQAVKDNLDEYVAELEDSGDAVVEFIDDWEAPARLRFTLFRDETQKEKDRRLKKIERQKNVRLRPKKRKRQETISCMKNCTRGLGMNKSEMEYHNRLDKLNANADRRSAWDSVDRPIRPLVYHLTRLGFQTIWSCCGFAYSGEEEPKSHANYTYVVVRPKDLKQLTWLANISRQSGWHIRSHHCTKEHSWWILMYEHKRTGGKHRWQSQEEGVPAIHDYEDPLIAIASLAGELRSIPPPQGGDVYYPPTYADAKHLPPLKDGNAIQKELMPELADEWQVEPKTKDDPTPEGVRRRNAPFRSGVILSPVSRAENERNDPESLPERNRC